MSSIIVGMLAATAAPSSQITAIEQQEQETSWAEELSMYAQIRDDPSMTTHKPLINSVDGTISWLLEDSKGQEYHLRVAQEEYSKNTASVDITTQTKYLKTKDGDIVAVRDYSQYVQPNVQLSELADKIYENAGNDYQFIYEVWYIVTHSTEYAHEDIENVGLPLQTLLKSRGDCEDLTILMASILEASSYAKDWQIKIVYFDALNPEGSNFVNHVALFIETDQFSTFVESTNSELNGLSVWHKVDGWYLDVNHSDKPNVPRL